MTNRRSNESAGCLLPRSVRKMALMPPVILACVRAKSKILSSSVPLSRGSALSVKDNLSLIVEKSFLGYFAVLLNTLGSGRGHFRTEATEVQKAMLSILRPQMVSVLGLMKIH